MPDLTVESFWRCDREQMVEVPASKRGTSYTVTVRGWEFSCTCPSFRFRKGHERDHCKHIAALIEQEKVCRWNQLLDGGSPARTRGGDYCCPRCAGPVTGFRAAV